MNTKKSILHSLVCPNCCRTLIADITNKCLICKTDKLAFDIINNIPVMLCEQANKLTEEEIKLYEKS